LLDAIRDRLNLTERTERLFAFHRQYHPRKVGYEQYAMSADVEHIRYVQAQQQYRFQLVELSGNVPKPDRIRGTIPLWESGRVWLPRRLLKKGYDGRIYDFVQQFVQDEFLTFPVGAHDDALDCMARLIDPLLGVTFPLASSGRSGYSDWHEQLPPAKPVTANNSYDVLP
jgi:phage terminase large subunit-like protein